MERGSHPVRRNGLLAAGLRSEGHRRVVRLPDHAARRGPPRRGRRRRRRRIEHRDLDGGVDRPAHHIRALPGQVLPRRCGAEHARTVDRLDRLRPRPVRGGLDRQPDQLDHRQRVRVQAAQGAAPGRHADPDPLRQDLPGPRTRHRDGTRAPRQVRPSAAGRHHQAQAGTLRPQLRPGRLRSPARRTGLHQRRREHQLPAVHALARPLPVLHGSRQPGAGRDR